MRIYFDENFSPHLVEGIRSFQNGRRSEAVSVLSVEEEFGRGCPDEEWIPGIAAKHGVVITQDTNVHRTRAQWDLCRANKIGMFFIKPPKNKAAWGYWPIIQLTVRLWPEIKRAAEELRRPFGMQIDGRTGKMSRL